MLSCVSRVVRVSCLVPRVSACVRSCAGCPCWHFILAVAACGCLTACKARSVRALEGSVRPGDGGEFPLWHEREGTWAAT